MTVVRTTNGPLEEYLVSYQSLLPSTIYSFRVIVYNKYGISYPVTSDDVVRIRFLIQNFNSIVLRILRVYLSAHCSVRSTCKSKIRNIVCVGRLGFHSFQTLPRIRISKDVSVLPSIMVHGGVSGWFYYRNHCCRSNTMREKQKL